MAGQLKVTMPQTIMLRYRLQLLLVAGLVLAVAIAGLVELTVRESTQSLFSLASRGVARTAMATVIRRMLEYESAERGYLITGRAEYLAPGAEVVNDINNAIAVLKRHGDHVVIDQKHETVKGWRLDQIVASDLFENVGPRDPETETLLEERGKLLSKPSLTSEDEERLKQLNDRIGPLPYGQTPDEMQAMEIIKRAAKKFENEAV